MISAGLNPDLLTYLIYPLLIFCSRVIDVSLGTIRIIAVSRSMKYLAPLLGFFEVLIWLFAIGHIMANLTNVFNYFAYAAGFAMGNFAGIWIEKKLAMGSAIIRIISNKDTNKLLQHLRKSGYLVTVVDGEGISGHVNILLIVVKRRESRAVVEIIKQNDHKAFYTIENVGFVSRNGTISLNGNGQRKYRRLLIPKKK
ncbi:DUF2179 domain-containing protein [candidate division KSB1 bacterium]|nr:DUF2179 domain-containing protein [candidate division KSB1 bacterium]